MIIDLNNSKKNNNQLLINLTKNYYGRIHGNN